MGWTLRSGPEGSRCVTWESLLCYHRIPLTTRMQASPWEDGVVAFAGRGSSGAILCVAL